LNPGDTRNSIELGNTSNYILNSGDTSNYIEPWGLKEDH